MAILIIHHFAGVTFHSLWKSCGAGNKPHSFCNAPLMNFKYPAIPIDTVVNCISHRYSMLVASYSNHLWDPPKRGKKPFGPCKTKPSLMQKMYLTSNIQCKKQWHFSANLFGDSYAYAACQSTKPTWLNILLNMASSQGPTLTASAVQNVFWRFKDLSTLQAIFAIWEFQPIPGVSGFAWPMSYFAVVIFLCPNRCPDQLDLDPLGIDSDLRITPK